MRVSGKERTKYKDGIKYVKADNPKLRRYLPVLEMKKIKADFDTKFFSRIQRIYEKEKSPLGYVSFWHLRDLPMRKVFECIKSYYQDNPYKICFQVNMVGQITSFKLLR